MEYKSEFYILNKFCEFKNRDIESAFMEYEKTASLTIARSMILLMGFVFAIFAISDYYFYGYGRSFIISLVLRVIALLIVIIVFFLSCSFKHYNHTLIMFSLAELMVFAIYLINLYNLKANQPSLQFMSLIIYLLAVFLIPNLWKNCLIVSCIILAGYIIFSAVFVTHPETPTLRQRGIYLGICLVSCAILLYGRESFRRRQYATEKHLEFMSITDRLTNIYNRGRFEYTLGLWIKNIRHDPFCLLLFDIDNFKKVNGHFGHSAGDQVLISTTKIVSTHIRDNDIFARWGGEEFVVLFSDVDIEQAAILGERLRRAVEDNYCGDAGKVTISIGITQYRRPETILDFVNRADEKMYEAKKTGKNCIVVADHPVEV